MVPLRFPDRPEDSERRAQITARHLLVGAFLVVAVATAAMFAQAATGHVASMHATSANVTVADYDVTDGDRLDLTLRVHNPTIRDLELGPALVNAYVDGEQTTDGTTTTFDGGPIPADETVEITGTLGLREAGGDRLRSADRVEVRGRLKVFVGDELIYVRVDTVGVSE
ncbi:hypothetical protein [Halorussus amylolyticus]|uniref:hypothetical protein n=1 Tax=Halorussus amylolyticus TaxID=1126242 RepID=UPI00104FBD32|nr:hypothetical protein [Halorussus amylolyticus]